MTTESKWTRLQMFADGGGDGAGAGAGAEAGAPDTGRKAPDAGEAELRAAGVSEEGIKRWAKRNQRLQQQRAQAGAAQVAEPKEAVAATQPEPADEAPKTEEAPVTEAPGRKTLRQLMEEDPELKREYDTEMQAAVKGRLKSSKGAKETMQALEPALMRAAQYYGLDIEHPDYKALAEKISADDRFSEGRALESGNTVEEQREIDAAAVQAVIERRNEQRNMEAEHAKRVVAEAKTLMQKYPGFDLMRECQNPAFERMIRPEGGATVEMAYRAVHYDELMRAETARAQEAAKAATVNAVRSGQARPTEVGSSGAAPQRTEIDPRRLTGDQRASIRRQVSAAAARGITLRWEDLDI